jgi:hypothetical protein
MVCFHNQKRPILQNFGEHGVDVMITIFAIFANLRQKIGVFSKTNVMIKCFAKTSSTLSKNANIFAKFFGENILKIITSVPRNGKCWYILWPFGNILRPFGIFYGHLLTMVVIWYIFSPFWCIVSRRIWQPCSRLVGRVQLFFRGTCFFGSKVFRRSGSARASQVIGSRYRANFLHSRSLQDFGSTRATRLGEFSPIGRLFTLGSFLKIAQVAHILGLLFPL